MTGPKVCPKCEGSGRLESVDIPGRAISTMVCDCTRADPAPGDGCDPRINYGRAKHDCAKALAAAQAQVERLRTLAKANNTLARMRVKQLDTAHTLIAQLHAALVEAYEMKQGWGHTVSNALSAHDAQQREGT